MLRKIATALSTIFFAVPFVAHLNAQDSPITYEERYLVGRQFQVATAGDLQVWASARGKGDIETLLYLANGSERAITFDPQTIQFDAVRTAQGKSYRLRLRTYSAEEYEKKIQTQQAWTAVLHGVSIGLANRPRPETSDVSGTYIADGSIGWYTGRITTWPSAADYAAANARSQAQIQAMASQLGASFSAMQATLLRRHTLGPRSFVGGVIHSKNIKADRYEMIVPFGDASFRFSFPVQK